MRQGQRGRDTGGRGCGGRDQRDSRVTRWVQLALGWVHLGLPWNRPWRTTGARVTRTRGVLRTEHDSSASV